MKVTLATLVGLNNLTEGPVELVMEAHTPDDGPWVMGTEYRLVPIDAAVSPVCPSLPSNRMEARWCKQHLRTITRQSCKNADGVCDVVTVEIHEKESCQGDREALCLADHKEGDKCHEPCF